MRKLGKRKKRKEKKRKEIPPSMVQFINCNSTNMFNPIRKRRIGVEDTMALGGGLMPKPIHFKERVALSQHKKFG
jgi:hypothetical protein